MTAELVLPMLREGTTGFAHLPFAGRCRPTVKVHRLLRSKQQQQAAIRYNNGLGHHVYCRAVVAFTVYERARRISIALAVHGSGAPVSAPHHVIWTRKIPWRGCWDLAVSVRGWLGIAMLPKLHCPVAVWHEQALA
jgi:hypothetical protein